MTLLLALATLANHTLFSLLGYTGISMVYLLCVVLAADFFTFLTSLFTAIAAFLSINYFFVTPRYTFQVENIESWATLIGFLVVSIVIASLAKRLKSQTAQSLIAAKHAEFSRVLAEHLALAIDTNTLLSQAAKLLEMEFGKNIAIAECDIQSNENPYHITHGSQMLQIEQSALIWVATTGKAMGPATTNWQESSVWAIPFSRLPSELPILLMNAIQPLQAHETLLALSACVEQVSMAFQRLANIQRANAAEKLAQEEAIQSALLASISHDMRTPLTSILGAATALLEKQVQLDAEQTHQLTALIAAEAQQLATSTENILSLVWLESSAKQAIPLDWQSPEEIIGLVLARYKARASVHHKPIPLLITDIKSSELLIKANAHLLIQAIINLVDNAYHVHQGNEPIMIEVRSITNKSEEQISICVKDRGTGFNKDFDVSRIKKFAHHAENKAGNKGFGLGLAIVQAIATLHNASLEIKPRVNGGSSVALVFPASTILTNSDERNEG